MKYYSTPEAVEADILAALACHPQEAAEVAQALADDGQLWKDADDGLGFLVDLESADLPAVLGAIRAEYEAADEMTIRNTRR